MVLYFFPSPRASISSRKLLRSSISWRTVPGKTNTLLNEWLWTTPQTPNESEDEILEKKIVVIVVNYNLHEINLDVKIYTETIFLKQLLSF